MAKQKTEQIRWREWSAKNFEEARKTKRPVLLDLFGTWCHWCKKMDEDCYEDAEIIKIINSRFIPIRVDIDRRPDLRERYNFGGFPTTAVLDGNGNIIVGGTYIPPEDLKELLTKVASEYEKGDLIGRGFDLKEEPSIEGGNLAEVPQKVLETATGIFDFDFGGFGTETKFPAFDALELALLQYKKTGDKRLLKLVTITLDGMKGIFDEEAGGFFRYSVTRDWKTPHYEKLTEINAGMIRNYVDAFAVTGEKELAEIVKKTIAYVMARLADQKEGGFYGSQTADPEDYYKASPEKRKTMQEPAVDRTKFTEWSAMMLSSFFYASAVLDDKKARDFALLSLEWILKKMRAPRDGFYHFHDGEKAQLSGLLGDNVAVGRALLDAYDATADKKYLEEALGLSTILAKKFYDVEKAGFFESLAEDDKEKIGLLKLRLKPLLDNAAAASFFARLGHMTGREDLLDVARKTLLKYLPEYERFGYTASGYALAILQLTEPAILTLIGPISDKKSKELWRAALREFEPRRVVRFVDPSDKKAFEETGYEYKGKPFLEICLGQRCLGLAEEVAAAKKFFEQLK